MTQCDYGVLENQLLRDQLVCGVGDTQLKDKLLQMEGLILQKSINMCRLSEHDTSMLTEKNGAISHGRNQVDVISRDGGRQKINT